MLYSQQFGDSKSQVRLKLANQFENFPKGWFEDESSIMGFSESGVIIYGFKKNILTSRGHNTKQLSLNDGYKTMKHYEKKYAKLGLSIDYFDSQLFASYSNNHYIAIKLSELDDGTIMLSHIENYDQ